RIDDRWRAFLRRERGGCGLLRPSAYCSCRDVCARDKGRHAEHDERLLPVCSAHSHIQTHLCTEAASLSLAPENCSDRALVLKHAQYIVLLLVDAVSGSG